ncbi:TonB-dependent receptor [Pedobacter sp. AW31-3R]|uniref:TonB-dependent receptor n=1 Tax=Pedobacter sp. AW31-3R TaxID=3445781 RepID=UPI003F9F045E
MKSFYFLLFCCGLFFIQKAKAQNVQNDTARVNKFITAPLDEVLDYLTANYQVKFMFDREEMHKINVSDHFFHDQVKEVIVQICKFNGIYYSKQPDGVYFILRKPDDIARVRRMAALAAQSNSSGGLSLRVKEELLRSKSSGKPVRTNFSLTGRVTDYITGESLSSASVKINGTAITAITNVDGYFNLQNVPADTCALLVTYSGYQASVERLTSERSEKTLVINLLPADNALNEVVINGKKDGVINTDTRKVSMIQLTPSKIAELPNIGERDILRAFQLMPGVSGSNESSSGAYVRGGTPDQNLVLFDGFTVYQVDHLYGFYSAFNVNAVKDVQLYKGGFSAKFGGRLSSVTDISGKEGNKKAASFGVDLSLLSLNLYGETPVNDKSSLLFSLRRSYQGPLYNKIFNKLNNTTTNTGGGMGGGPGGGMANNQTQVSSWFYDLNGKYTYTADDKNIFSLSFYSGKDNLDNSHDLGIPAALSSTLNSSSITDLTNYGNVGSSAKWSRRWTDKLYSNTLVSFSNYFSDRDRSTSSSITDTTGTTAAVNSGTFEKNNLKDYSAKSDWEWNISNHGKISFGGFASIQDIRYSYAQSDTAFLINQHNRGLSIGGYAELEQNFGGLRVQPGLRFTHYDITGKNYVEPRFSASYALNDRLMLKLATGRFYQFSNRVIREDITSGSKDFWVLANGSSIPVGSAMHYILGTSYEVDKYLFSVEAYYKKLSGLTEYSLRQSGSGEPMGPNASVTLEENFYNGEGYAKGIEFMAQKKVGKYTGWVSYTLAEAYNKFDVYGTDYFPASQDVRHEFKSINIYHEGRWTLSATWIYASGRPYTAPVGSYTIERVGAGTKTYFVISGKNTERLKAYHRLDAAVTYDLIKTNSKKIGTIGFSLFNMYNRSNTWYREYSIQGNQVISTDVNYLGFTPNITLSLKW